MSKFPIPKSFKADVDRALHNLYCEKRTTLHPMTLIPIYYRRMMRGDVFDFGVVESILRSEPTFAPLLANWRLRFEWYFDSDANRYSWIGNNTRLPPEQVMNRVHHRYTTNKVIYQGNDIGADNVVGRGGIADYAGIAPGFTFVEMSDGGDYQMVGDYGSVFNIDFHLTYLNIIRNYHVNKQFPNIPYLLGMSREDNQYSRLTDVYSLDDLDNLFLLLRSCSNGVKFDLYNDSDDIPTELSSYYEGAAYKFSQYLRATENSFGGLFCSQFEPDLYQNLLSRDSGLLRASASVSNGGVTIEEFRLKNHLQGLYDKIFVSGGTDRDLSRTIWGIESNRNYDIPELLCVHSEIIGTNLITSTTAGSSTYAGEDISNVPGSMAGNISSHRGAGRIQKFKANTSGSLMCIVSLVPLVDYCQNIERNLLDTYFMDEFTPDMARKGFENVPLSDYCALPQFMGEGELGNSQVTDFTGHPLKYSVGRQVAWLREMTAVNRVHGEFSNFGEKSDWVLVKKYLRPEGGVFDTQNGYTCQITPYGDPLEFQYPFVSQTIADPNFYLQVGFKCRAYRPVPRKFMPNLGY